MVRTPIDPPVTILEVYGATPADYMRRELGHYGYDTIEPTSDGFRATRKNPETAKIE